MARKNKFIQNYTTNSTNLLINKELNQNYLTNNINNLCKTKTKMNLISDNILLYSNISTLVFIICIIYFRLDKINGLTFMVYFLLLYDIQAITSKVIFYNKNKIFYNRFPSRINYMNKLIPSYFVPEIKTKITQITINSISNKVPNISLNTKIIINENNHILIDGISGSGKTTLLYILSNLLKPDQIDIIPNIDEINNQSYITLPQYKGIIDGNLYDIISNHNSDPDIELINYSIKTSQFKISDNILIHVNNISAGEHMRLLLARIIYSVKSNPRFNILLLDEIDQNLNDNLAISIATELLNIFIDKIIFYITHNDKVKNLFTKKLMVNNGNISFID